MIGQTISHYRILEKLGSGGMGVVYKAEDTKLGRLVALKFLPDTVVLDGAALERFPSRGPFASALNHPNICTIYEVDDADGKPFIAMELLQGVSLAHRIGGSPLPVREVIELGTQLADTLDAAHSMGVLHRDLKPGNIFVTRRSQAKLLDFGLAKMFGIRPKRQPCNSNSKAIRPDSLTTRGVAMGTFAYMSPEQARGEELDGRSDLFSLGLCSTRWPPAGRRSLEQPTPLCSMASCIRTPSLRRVGIRRARRKWIASSARPSRRNAKTVTHQRVSFGGSEAAAITIIRHSGRSQFCTLLRPQRSRDPCLVAAGGFLGAGWWYRHDAPKRWAKAQAIPEIAQLMEKGQYFAAYRLARRADPTYQTIRPSPDCGSIIPCRPPGN